MGFWARLKNAFRASHVSGVELMTERGNSYISWQGSVYDFDVVRAAMRPTVSAVGKLVAKHIRETLKDGTRELSINPDVNIRFLLEEPNPLMTGQDLQEKLAAQLLLNSNAFALIMRNDHGTPVAIYPIEARNVEAIYSGQGELFIKFTLPNNKVFTFPYTDLIHLRKDFNQNDVFGTPIAPALTPLLEVVSTTDQGIINAVKNSSVVKWLLKFTTAMRDEDLTNKAKDFAENYLSTSEGTGVAAVDAKADAVQIKPHDYVPNALTMTNNQKRILDLFGVSPEIVSNAYTEDAYNAFFDGMVEPIERKLALEFTRKLFTRRERVFGSRIVFEASAWDAASFSTKLALQAMVDRGALTPNEWRATLNLAPVPGGDTPIRRLDTDTVTTGISEEGGNTDED